MERGCEQREFDYAQAGYTLVELLVSMMIGAVVLMGAVRQYFLSVEQARDNQIRTSTFLQAQALVQNIGFELRTLGNGVPFDQAHFQIGEASLSNPTVTEPIDIAATTADQITFRVNETGDVFLLTANFYPSINRTAFLTDVTSLQAGDPIYISNSVVAGDDGLYGVIESVDTANSSITIEADYVNTPFSTFDKGSAVEEVRSVIYLNDSVSKEITRDSGYGPVSVAKNATMQFDYLDSSGTALTLPLTNTVVVDSLRAITVTVTVTSTKKLTNTNQFYVATASQTFGLRNLNYLF